MVGQCNQEGLHLFRDGVIERRTLRQLWPWEQGQDLAEYAVMIAVILVIVIGTVKLINTKTRSKPPNTGSALSR